MRFRIAGSLLVAEPTGAPTTTVVMVWRDSHEVDASMRLRDEVGPRGAGTYDSA